MEKKRSRIHGFSLVEMLLVLAIFVVLGSFGAGAFLGFRETTLVRENVEILKQEIQLAQQKSMLLERDVTDNWLYGIGIDFSTISSEADTSYSMFRWCSPFEDFGSAATTSKVLGWDPSAEIGVPMTQVLGASDNIYAQRNITPTLPIMDDDGGGFCRTYYYRPSCRITDMCCVCTSYMTVVYPNACPAIEKCCRVVAPPPEEQTPQEPEPPVTPPPSDNPDTEGVSIKNGYLPPSGWSEQCSVGSTSLVKITGQAGDNFVNAGNISLLGDDGSVRYLVFEAVTGKAFLYDKDGKPINYSNTGEFLGPYDSSGKFRVLDILITRKRSSRFDLISVYPGSGTIVHHSYDSSDLFKSGDDDSSSITVDGKKYKRFGVFDEISSYRE